MNDIELSPRYHRIVYNIACGYTNNEIAEIMGITSSTVANHITAIMKSFQVHDRLELVVKALKIGIIHIESIALVDRSGK